VLHLSDVLLDYERANGGVVVPSPIDIVFSEHNVVQPDVVFFRRERRHLVAQWEANRVAPDLVVEVLSRNTEARDRGRKMTMFARFGVPEYWMVDPAGNTLEVLVLSAGAFDLRGMFGDGDVVTSVTLPDLTFPAANVFAE
jgi:Uma2 family endonuclease